MEARDVSLFAETAQEIGEQRLTMQISCWIDIGRVETMQPHVLAALHMHHCGVVLCRASCDKLTTEVVHGQYTVASTLQYHRGLLGDGDVEGAHVAENPRSSCVQKLLGLSPTRDAVYLVKYSTAV